MKTRKLGKLEVSPIGVECMGFSHGYGEIPSEEYSVEAIRKAYQLGCTFYDTAEAYGPNLLPENRGHNERILGKAVKDFRKDVVLATKLHLPTEEVAQKGLYSTIRAHLEASMERLQTDYVDLYYLHRVNPELPLEDVSEAMGTLIRDGLSRGWGLSQVSVEMIRKAHQITPVSAVQNIYSMVERGIEEDVRKFVPQLQQENIQANQPILHLLDEYAKKKNAAKAQLSLAWMLHKYPNIVPIPGSKNQERILENLGAWNVVFTDEEFRELEQSLEKIPVHGHRGYVEVEGGSMRNWGKSDKEKKK